ncbi:hypothetical protein ACFQ4N_01250 [Oceanobacillus iheyensis]|uniref:Uncharacterized protein n=1 Tax=Oceanobacillus iheyensis (strain DSM 14371 / CIP 107618 / JCM 11309 / KCTC 3954 / HTE831) TaxID=221109 RepID=Q8END6_OCEIH|nr:hypothetical protein [Oceanobacillus iheyensis]BAC14506.1 hypothetical protein [Oceanobacillus iheyensis HTE831]
MTPEMIDRLLLNITELLNEVENIQENSYQMDELVKELESKIENMETNIDDLEKNANQLNDRFFSVIDKAKETINTRHVG